VPPARAVQEREGPVGRLLERSRLKTTNTKDAHPRANGRKRRGLVPPDPADWYFEPSREEQRRLDELEELERHVEGADERLRQLHEDATLLRAAARAQDRRDREEMCIIDQAAAAHDTRLPLDHGRLPDESLREDDVQDEVESALWREREEEPLAGEALDGVEDAYRAAERGRRALEEATTSADGHTLDATALHRLACSPTSAFHREWLGGFIGGREERTPGDMRVALLIPRWLIVATGDLAEQHLLAHLLYWFSRAYDGKGNGNGKARTRCHRDGQAWVYRTDAAMALATGVAERSLARVRGRLARRGLIAVEYHRVAAVTADGQRNYGARVCHYRPLWPGLLDAYLAGGGSADASGLDYLHRADALDRRRAHPR
jgi:hypothetical protein